MIVEGLFYMLMYVPPLVLITGIFLLIYTRLMELLNIHMRLITSAIIIYLVSVLGLINVELFEMNIYLAALPFWVLLYPFFAFYTTKMIPMRSSSRSETK